MADRSPLSRYWAVGASLGVVLFLTLFPTGGARNPDGFWCLRCSGYASHADLILNVLLFAPLGLSFRHAGLGPKRSVLVVVGMTVTIEALQYAFIPGRDATVRDCITNSLGGMSGIFAYPWIHKVWKPDRAVARVLVVAATLVLMAHAALAVIAFHPSSTTANYYGQVTPVLGQFKPFHGTVSRSALNGIPISTDLLPASAATAARSPDSVVLSADVQASAITTAIAPVVSVADGDGNEIVLLGQHGTAAMVRVRMRAHRLGLRVPALDLPGALTPDRRVSLAGGRTGFQLHIVATYPDGSREQSSLRLSPAIGWALWWPFDMFSTNRLWVITGVWLGVPLLAIGFWSGRAFQATREERPANGTISAIMATLGAALACQVLVPLAMGGVATNDPRDLAATAIGSALGLVLGLRTGAPKRK